MGVPNVGDPCPPFFDPAHEIRALGWWIAAWELTDSPCAARQILGLAETNRLTYSESGPAPAYGYTPNNLRNWIAQLRAKPGVGMAGSVFGRQVGWPATCIAMALKLNAG